MFKHNLTLIFRNFKRFKGTFFINLIGLSTGLACALLIYLWVNDELSMDKFHEHDKRLYQVMLNHQNNDKIETAEASPAPLADALKNEMPEVEYAITTTLGVDIPPLLLSTDEESVKAPMQFVGADFFKMFSYKLLAGDEENVLKDKNNIVISHTLAMNLFNSIENALGKVVKFRNEESYTVSGIFESKKDHSSIQFEYLLSAEVFKELMGPGAEDWGTTGPRTFVLLGEGTNLADFNSKVAGFIKSKNNTSNADVFLRHFSDKYLYNKFENGKQAGGRIEYVRLFSVIAIFIVLIACINFMNLSTAKATRRLKEVGIKKAIGAARKWLVIQYLSESIVMAFISLFIAGLLVIVFLPAFNQITGKELHLTLNLNLILIALSITLLTGLFSGSYPALYISGFSPIKVLKGKIYSSSVAEAWARKGLVVFQFALSVILIVSVFVVYKQIQFVQSKNLGYDKSNVILIDMEGEVMRNLETFLTEVKNIPGILNASSTSHRLLGHQSQTNGIAWEGKDEEDVIPFEIVWANHDLIELLEIDMVQGRSFSRNSLSDSSKIILNETAVKVMNMKDPVGKMINLWGQPREIVGVTNDFNFKSLHEKVTPLFFILDPQNTQSVVVRVAAGRESEAIAGLQQLYQRFNPQFVFEYKFLDQDYQKLYLAEQRVASLSKYFAFLAILISCLGLLALAAFAAERKVKEIGIRKVLGSSEFQIVKLLTSDFTKTVLAAIIISIPISYWIASNWLQGFEYRIDLEWWYFAGAGAIALLVAWLTVASQAIKAAIANPVKSLKYE